MEKSIRMRSDKVQKFEFIHRSHVYVWQIVIQFLVKIWLSENLLLPLLFSNSIFLI